MSPTPNVNIEACVKLGFKPTITLIIVGKRHHVRFFPCVQNESDRSGNCVAGTVVDSDVVNPVEFDFYLLSHGGILGTSRPAHYNVLVDENRFTYVTSTLDVSLARGLTMLTLCPVLTVYNHSRTCFVTFTRELLAPSPYRHRFIVMLCSLSSHITTDWLSPQMPTLCALAPSTITIRNRVSTSPRRKLPLTQQRRRWRDSGRLSDRPTTG